MTENDRWDLIRPVKG